MLSPVKGHHIRSASTASFLHIARYQARAPRAHRQPSSLLRLPLSHSRWQATAAVAQAQSATKSSNKPPKSLAIPSESSENEIGVQHISKYIFEQIFPRVNREDRPPEELVELSKDHLDRHKLLGKHTDHNPPIAFDVPQLQAPDTGTLDEHFYRLGTDCAEPFLGYAKEFASAIINPPPRPKKWKSQSGWTKYPHNLDPPKKVDAPEEKMLCFDVEVLYKETNFAVMACALSPEAWYAWVSPWLLGETDDKKCLIPLGDPKQERVIVGHNVGYDRARVLEEYDLNQTRNAFIDTMSLHVAVNGMCSQQRPTWMKHKKSRELREKISKETNNIELATLLASNSLREDEEDLWVERSAVNSLRDVAQFHLGETMDKTARDDFGELDREGIVKKLDVLLDYCAVDVAMTYRVYQTVFPLFLNVCPHPVSFAALRHLSSVILPVNKSWEAYKHNAEMTYINLSNAVQDRLKGLACNATLLKDDPDQWGNDPWLKQLDWSGQVIKMVKGKKKDDPPRQAKRQKQPGMPKWYKDLFPKAESEIEDMNLTVRTRIAPLLLRLSWDGYPLFWSDKYGWTFRVPVSDASKYKETQLVRCDFSDESNEALKNDFDHLYLKLPHKDGPDSRCVTPLAKSYLTYFDKGTLSSEYPYAKEALDMNASCSYWISARDRIRQQMVIYEDGSSSGVLPDKKKEAEKKAAIKAAKEAAKEADNDAENEVKKEVEKEVEKEVGFEAGKDADTLGDGRPQSENAPAPAELVEVDESIQGIILPQVIPMGTVTRRAVENTWLTASNAKKNRVGSELKAMVKAPPGYCFVGADVDSEELWIASVVGDATFKLHGGNAIGFMTLEGTKAAGTDLHSVSASILGITRNDAKVFNYGRIYGAGLKFAATLLRQFNPGLSDQETLEIANKLYARTKGTKTSRKALHERPFWRGGSESFVFNKLEEFAEQQNPRTPVLGAGITEALRGRYIRKGGYLTSRINWAIQSSGVDYLHLLVVSMDYLTRRFNLKARLAITVHDEIRYLVKEEDKYRAAMALQVANLWTRAMFAEQVGIKDLPQSCAYFSAVDIDHVLRKEVDLPCVTPSHPNPIPPGKSIGIVELLEKGAEAWLDPSIKPSGHAPKPEEIHYTPRVPVMETLDTKRDPDDMSLIKAQITNDDQELREIMKAVRKKMPPPSSSDGEPTSRGAARKPRQKKISAYSSQAELIPHMVRPFASTKFTSSKPTKKTQDSGMWIFEEMPPPPSGYPPRNLKGL